MRDLPAFAEVDDLADRLTITDQTRAQAALDDASALIRAETGTVTWVDQTTNRLSTDVPAIIKLICLDIASDRYSNPGGLRQESIGGYSYTVSGDGVGGRQLTALQKAQVRRAAGLGIVGDVTLESPYDVPADTIWVQTEPAGEPMPWAAIQELPT